MIFCGICQGTIDRSPEAPVVSLCSGCRQRLREELPRIARSEQMPGVLKKCRPISQHGFSAFDVSRRPL